MVKSMTGKKKKKKKITLFLWIAAGGICSMQGAEWAGPYVQEAGWVLGLKG